MTGMNIETGIKKTGEKTCETCMWYPKCSEAFCNEECSDHTPLENDEVSKEYEEILEYRASVYRKQVEEMNS